MRNLGTHKYTLYIGPYRGMPCSKPDSIEQVERIVYAHTWANGHSWKVVNITTGETVMTGKGN